MWGRNGPGYRFSESHSGPGTKTPFGRDAANVGNGVEASGQRPEVRSRRDNRHTFNLDQCLVLEEARNLKKSSGRVVISKKRAMHLAQGLEMGKVVVAVAHKNSDFHDVLHLPTGCFDYCLEVTKHLFVLGDKITWCHNIAFSIAACLPGQEQELPARYENAVA